MREIKFRGKRIHDNEWMYGNLIVDNIGNKYIVPFEFFESDGHHLMYVDDTDLPVFIDENTIGQYTGLKDCTGRKIYEGDIAQWKEYDICSGAGRTYRGRVEFHNGLFRIGSFLLYNLVSKRGFKIIGNIYENPELLEENNENSC